MPEKIRHRIILNILFNTWNKIVEKEKMFDKITDCRLWAAALEYDFAITVKIPMNPGRNKHKIFGGYE